MPAAASPVDPESTPGVWRGAALAGGPAIGTVSSSDRALDAQLPGGGWPLGSLTEVLQPQPGSELRLLRAPVSAVARRGPVVLIGAPHRPNLAALAAQGVPVEQLLVVDADTPAQRLWTTEQALRCAGVSAVLAWLPQARAEQLRRLQLAVAGRGQALAFAFRAEAARADASAAPLRLVVRSRGLAGLQVEIIKRRGPPLDEPLLVATALPAMLPPALPRAGSA